MQTVRVAFLLLAVVVLTCSAVKYRDCGSASAKLVNVVIPGCENMDRCPLKKGTNASVSVVFTPNAQTTSVTSKVYGILGFVNASFPLPNDNGCVNSNLTCPLTGGQTYTLASSIYVDPIYPDVQVTVQWEAFDQNNARLFCFLVPCQVSSSFDRKYYPELLRKLVVEPIRA